VTNRKKLTMVHVKTASGRSPVLEYILDLAKPERARITNIGALDQVERHGFDAIRVAEELPPHASWDELKKASDEGFRAGKEIIASEFRTRSELNQPYVWKPPLVSEVDMPARVVIGVMIPAHRELVIVRAGYWVRTENFLQDK
jgi:hypothetical protein